MYLNESKLCWRWGTNTGTVINIFWSCIQLVTFCAKIKKLHRKMVNIPIPDNLAFFYCTSPMHKTFQQSVLKHLLKAARSCIPWPGNKKTPPSVALWACKVETTKITEDLIPSSLNCQNSYRDIWFFWLEFYIQVKARPFSRRVFPTPQST